ncbi:STAS domain-containing protein [Microbispora sp. RL4-1S]|uniref:Anti-sigma factor antagonist n=1 Tax=Microbispora oryzae TaxID=2806554 RepID=A0A940WIZ2_9ACTN|nr:STAS domain-containing protein [Microbispora oryzae]MBP2706475.1 STAS domain-containing protein [Microbispora oryzae]
METWTIKTPDDTRWAVIALSGEFDLYAVRRLREPITTLIEDNGPWIALDLSQVWFIDTTAVGMLVRLVHHLRAGDGDLALVAPRGQVRRILRWTNLTCLFPVFDSLSDMLGDPATR